MSQSNRSFAQIADVVRFRAIAELRAEATRTYAGYLWWIFLPLLSLAVYYVAFKWVLTGRDGFAVYLFTGIVLWHWFQTSTVRASESLINAQGLMNQAAIHKSVFPLSIVAVNTGKFLVTLVLLAIILVATGHQITWAWLATIPVLLIQLAVITGTSTVAAMICPFLPDLRHVISTALHLMFFVSGILYDLSKLPDHVESLLRLNPMAVIIEQFRIITLDGAWPDWGALALPLGQGVFLITIGLALLHRFNTIYPKLS